MKGFPFVFAVVFILSVFLLPHPCYGVPSSQNTTDALRASLNIGTGIEKETGRNAWVTKVGFCLGYGAFSALLDASTAFPENALDAAGIRFDYCWIPFPWLGIRPQALVRWRSFGTAGDETRFGFILYADAGAPADTMGFVFGVFGGYTYLLTRIPVLDLVWGDHDPVVGFDVSWHNGTGLVFRAGWSSYTPDDAGIFLKSFFKFGTEFVFKGLTVSADLTLKYSDMLTLTAYLDGYALRLAVNIPMDGFFR